MYFINTILKYFIMSDSTFVVKAFQRCSILFVSRVILKVQILYVVKFLSISVSILTKCYHTIFNSKCSNENYSYAK